MNKRRHLRKAPHDVYRIRDSAGALLYVGCSVNAFKRVQQHKSECQPWFPIAATVDVAQYQDMTSAQYVEAEAIANEAPIWNRQAEPRALLRQHLANPEPIEQFRGIPVSDFWAAE